MQMINRIKCLALAAVALAFAQLPALAADSEVSTDPNEPRYSIDGETFYKYEDWNTVLAAIGDGGDEGNVMTAQVQNVVFKRDDFIKRGNVSGWQTFYTPIGNFGYVTLMFEKCEFSGKDSTQGNCFGFTNHSKKGVTIALIDCCSDAPYFMQSQNMSEGRYPVDLYVDGGTFYHLGYGCWFGDLTVINATLTEEGNPINVNAGFDGFVASNAFDTATAKFRLENCMFTGSETNRILTYACRFGEYTIKDVRTVNATGDDLVSYAASGYYSQQVGSFRCENLGTGDCVVKSDLEKGFNAYYLVTPLHVLYNANGGVGVVPTDPDSYCYEDDFTVKPGNGLKKDGNVVIGWCNSSTGSDVTHEIGGIYQVPFIGITLYAIYGEAPLVQTGLYRISCPTPTDAQKGIDGVKAESGLWYKDYPWYSDANWVTNVYDTVKTVWGNGSSEHPLTVTIWGQNKDSGEREPLLLGDGDMMKEKATGGFAGASVLCYDSGIKSTTFVFSNCVWTASNVSTGDDKKGRYIIGTSDGGVDFVFKDGIMTNSVTTINANGEYNVGLTFDGVRFEASCSYTQYYAANVEYRNCTFAAGYFNKIVHATDEGWNENWQNSGGNSSDVSGDALAAYTNNIWEGVSPGQHLVQFGNYDYAKFGDSKIGTDAAGFTDLYVDTLVLNGVWNPVSDDKQTMTNETNVCYDQKDVHNFRRQVRVVVHPVTVTFKPLPSKPETNFYAVVGLSDLWTSTGDNYRPADASVDDFPDVTTPGNLWYEQSDMMKGYTVAELVDMYKDSSFTADLTFIEDAPRTPELVGTLKMSSFVQGHPTATPSGLSWRCGKNGTLHPLELDDDNSKYEYFIYSDASCTGDGTPATLDNLMKLTADGEKGRDDYYIRGEVTDFKAETSDEYDALQSEPAKFTVVNPNHSDYSDYVFTDWIESTGCQYLDTLVDPALNGDADFGFALDFVDDCYLPVSKGGEIGISGNGDGNAVLGSTVTTGGDWWGLLLSNWNIMRSDGHVCSGQLGFCRQFYNQSFKYWLNPCLTNDVRIQILFTNSYYSISSSELDSYGHEETQETNTCQYFRGSVLLAAYHDDNYGASGRGSNHNMHFYGLRFYNGTELIYEGIPAIDKKTGHRGLLRINGDKGDEFIYSATYTNGLDIVTNTAESAATYVANLGDKMTGPLGLNEFNTPLEDFSTFIGETDPSLTVRGKDAAALDAALYDSLKTRLLDFEGQATRNYRDGDMSDVAMTLLYAPADLGVDKDWTNTVVNANLTDATAATLGNGTLALFADWAALPPEGATEYKVAILTAVSKPLVRTVTAQLNVNVTLDPNGGTVVSNTVTATCGETMPTLVRTQIAKRLGYAFQGYTNSNGVAYYDANGTGAKACDLASGATLYANWKYVIPGDYDQLSYLDNGTETNLAGYVELTDLHLAGTNVVEIGYCFNTSYNGYQHLFGERQLKDGKFSEYILNWTNREEGQNSLMLGYGECDDSEDRAEHVSHRIDNSGAVGTEKDYAVRVVPGLGEQYVSGTINDEALSLSFGGQWRSFEHTLDNNLLVFTVDSVMKCDGVPAAYDNGMMSAAALAKIYYFSVEASADDPTLLIELVPVERVEDGQRGFYDMVNGGFYPLKHPIMLDGNGGEPAERYVYAARGENFPEVEPPTWPGHVFLGYYSNKTDSASVKFYDADGISVAKCPFAEATNATLRAGEQNTIYAHWLECIDLPTAVEGLVYDGTAQTGVVVGADAPYEVVGTSNTGKDAGTYSAEIKPKEGFCWDDGTMTNCTVVFTIKPRQVTIISEEHEFTYNGAGQDWPVAYVKEAFDGDGGHGFVDGEGVTTNGFATITSVSESGKGNTFEYGFNEGTLDMNYEVTKDETALLTMKNASAPKIDGTEDPQPFDPGKGGEEPQSPTNPQGGKKKLSDFDCVAMYDGEGHTVDLDALMGSIGKQQWYGNERNAWFSTDGMSWQSEPFTYTNVVSTSFWYKVEAENFDTYVHAVGVSVTNRPVEIKTGSKSFTYDGQAHSYTNLEAGLNGFVAGEGFATSSNWATVTTVGEGEVPNTCDFTIAYNEGSSEANYLFTTNWGKIWIEKADEAKIVITGAVKTVTYDGNDQEVKGWFIADAPEALDRSLVKLAAGHENDATTNGVAAGTYTMAMSDESFVCTDPNFSKVTFQVTPGKLEIVKATYPGTIEWVKPDGKTTFIYDGEEKVFEVTGHPAGVTPIYTDNTGTHVSNHVAHVAFEYDETNYNAPVAPADLEWSITKRPLVFTTAGASWEYDGTEHVLPLDKIAADSYAPGETFTYTKLATITEVGKVDATFDYSNGTADTNDYEVSWGTIGKLEVTVSKNQLEVILPSETFAYDGQAHSNVNWTVKNEDLLLEGHKLAVEVSSASVVTTPDDGEVPNVFAKVAIMNGDTDVTKNYNLVKTPGVLMVTNANIVVTGAEGFGYKGKYDGAAHGIQVSVPTLTDGTEPKVAYALTADGPFGAEIKSNDVCDVTVWYRLTAPYYNDYTGSATLKILPRAVTFTSVGGEKAYDGLPLKTDLTKVTLSGDGFVTGEGYELSNPASITEVGQTEATFDVTLKDGTKAMNYTITKVETAKLRISAGDAIVVTADTKLDFVFDDAPHALQTYTQSGSGTLQAGDELEVVFDEASKISRPDETPVENHIVTVRVWHVEGEARTDRTSSYVLEVYDGQLGMLPATIDWKDADGNPIDTTAFGETTVYDAETHSIHVVKPTLLTEPVTVRYCTTRDGTYSETQPEYVDVGTYDIFYEVSADCYYWETNKATVTITNRVVELTSASARKVWDGTPLTTNEVTVTAGSFAGSETFTYNCTGSQTDGGGSCDNTFTYELANGGKASNYTVVPKYGKLVVDNAEFDFTEPDYVLKSYEDAYDAAGHTIEVSVPAKDPKYLFSLENVTAEEAYSDVAPMWTNVTETARTVYVLVKAPNYNPFYTNATVTITQAVVTVTSGDKTDFVFDGQPHAYTNLTVTGFAGGDHVATTSNWATVTQAGDEKENSCVWTFGRGEANLLSTLDNYTVVTNWGTIKVLKAGEATIVITGAVESVTYDGKDHVVDGWFIADAPKTLNRSLVKLASEHENDATTNGVAAGTYTMAMTKDSFDCTDPNFESFAFQVTPGVLTINRKAVDGDSGVTVGGVTEKCYYDGKGHEPTPAVTDKKAETNPVEGKDFEYVYEDNTNATTAATKTAKVIVDFDQQNGNYSGAITNEFPISPRTVTLTSGSDTFVYDGESHSNVTVTASEYDGNVKPDKGHGFVPGEGFTSNVTATISTVAESPKDNAFTYGFAEGTLSGNYAVTCVTGKLEVVKAKVVDPFGPTVEDPENPHDPFAPESDEDLAKALARANVEWTYDATTRGLDVESILCAALKTAGTTVSYSDVKLAAGEEGWSDTSRQVKHVADSTNLWFRLTSANYEPFVTNAFLKVTKRPITLQGPKTTGVVFTGAEIGLNLENVTGHDYAFVDGDSTSGEMEKFEYYDSETARLARTEPWTLSFKYRDGSNPETYTNDYEVTLIPGSVQIVPDPELNVVFKSASETRCYTGEEWSNTNWSCEQQESLEEKGFHLAVEMAETKIMYPGSVDNEFAEYDVLDDENKSVTNSFVVTTELGKLTVTNANLVFNGDAAKNWVGYYDGKGHDITVNTPKSVDGKQEVHVGYALTAEGPFVEEPILFTNVTAGATSVWYCCWATYHNAYTNSATVTVNPLPVTFTSTPNKSPVAYTGEDYSWNNVTIDATIGVKPDLRETFPEGEGFSFAERAQFRDPGDHSLTFTAVPNDKTDISNYAISYDCGKVHINNPGANFNLTAQGGIWCYDGEAHSNVVAVLTYKDGSPRASLDGEDYVTNVTMTADSVITLPGVTNNIIGSYEVWRGDALLETWVRDGMNTGIYKDAIELIEGVLTVTNRVIEWKDEDGKTIDRSAFDVTAVYDGDGHTIKFVKPTLEYAAGDETVVKFRDADLGGEWQDWQPAYTNANAGESSYHVEYQVSATGYETFVGTNSVRITKRQVTFLSGSVTNVYVRGQKIFCEAVTTNEGSMVATDTVTFSNFTHDGPKVATYVNAYEYKITDRWGLEPENYTVTPKYGDLVITAATMDFAQPDYSETPVDAIYDGTGHSIGISAPLQPENVKYYYALNTNGLEKLDWMKGTENPVFTNVVATNVYVLITADNYHDFKTNVAVRIRPAELTAGMVTLTPVATNYTGSSVRPEVAVAADEPMRIAEGTDYESSWSPDAIILAGDYTNVVAALNEKDSTDGSRGNYWGAVTNVFTVNKAKADDDDGKFAPIDGCFGATNVYDAAGHTVNTNLISQFYTDKATAETHSDFIPAGWFENGNPDSVKIEYAAMAEGPFGEFVPDCTNVVETQVWFRVSCANFNAFTNSAALAITPRTVTLTSGSREFPYDGNPHAWTNLTAEGFVGGDHVATTSNWATVTNLDESKDNSCDWTFGSGGVNPSSTLANYAVTTNWGTIKIVQQTAGVIVTITGACDTVTYDGDNHDVSGWSVKSIEGEGAEGYKAEFVEVKDGLDWMTATNGTHAGTYKMAMDENTFMNKNIAFSQVTFLVTPGVLTINRKSVDGDSGVTVGGVTEKCYYDGKGHEPTPAVTDKKAGTNPDRGKDFEYVYENNTNATTTATKTAKVIVDFDQQNGNYSGAITNEFPISPRTVTLTSGSNTNTLSETTEAFDGAPFTYDGNAHSNVNVMVTEFNADKGTGFVDGEGVKTNGFATITNVVDSPKDNSFSYEPMNDKTLLNVNYTVTVVTGKLGMVNAKIKPDPIEPVAPGGGDDPGVEPINPPTPIPTPVGPKKPEGAPEATGQGVKGEYDGAGHGIKAEVEIPKDAKAMFWNPETPDYDLEESPTFTEVGTNWVYYAIKFPNYDPIETNAVVIITERSITNATVEINGGAKKIKVGDPLTFTITDDPKSSGTNTVTALDYDAQWIGTNKPGTAKLEIRGKHNYDDVKTIEFELAPRMALLKAEIGWQLSPDSGTYFAQIRVTCTNETDEKVSDLKYLFGDRTKDGTTYAQLWNWREYGPADMDAATGLRKAQLIEAGAGEAFDLNEMKKYGVKNLKSTGVVPMDEDGIELYVRTALAPVPANAARSMVSNFVGYLSYVSGGETNVLTLAQDDAAKKALAKIGPTTAPLSLGVLNNSIAVGVALEGDLAPYCRVTAFETEGDAIAGVLEVGAETPDGFPNVGSIGTNAKVTLWGAKDLDGAWRSLGEIKVGEDGAFSFSGVGDERFFKLSLESKDILR